MKLINQSYEIECFEPEMDILRIAKAICKCYKTKLPKTHEERCKLVERVLNKDPDHPHRSPLEHSSLSVSFITNRGVTHELVRHRLASYAQESTRYCDYSKDKFGNELTFIQNSKFTFGTKECDRWKIELRMIEATYLHLKKSGYSPDIIRGILPNDIKTEIMVTTNYREWMHIFNLRCDSHAHYQMQELMRPLYSELHEALPCVFNGIEW